MNHNIQQKVAYISDFSSFGRCSATVSIPILAALKIQCCVVPTSLFTNHTAFERYSQYDLTGFMKNFIRDWQSTGLSFSAIEIGYLNSKVQIDTAKEFINTFKSSTVLLDPIMGDNGKLYSCFDLDLKTKLEELLPMSNIITPNLTEAFALCHIPYENHPNKNTILKLADLLHAKGPKYVIITGIVINNSFYNFISEKDNGCSFIPFKKTGKNRCGTGDAFSSLILASFINGNSIQDSIRTASDFISHTIEVADKLEIPTSDGLPIEETLSLLINK